MVKLSQILVSVFSLATISFSAHAMPKCAAINETVTLQGVATLSAAYIDPRDFGWAPKNGFQSYAVLVTPTPVCLDDGSEVIDGIRVLQVFGVALPSQEDLKKGVVVRVKGTLMPEQTAHHFQPLLIHATEVTVLN